MLARNLKDAYPKDVQDSPAVRRRSIYMFHKRVVPYPLLQAFDKPDAQQSCGRRDNTTVAPQALALLNDAFVRMVSQDFADRLLKESAANPENASIAGLPAGARQSASRRRIGGLVVLYRDADSRTDEAVGPDACRRNPPPIADRFLPGDLQLE